MRYIELCSSLVESSFTFIPGDHTKASHVLDDGSTIPSEMHEVHYHGKHLGNVATYIPHGVPRTKENIKVGAMPTQSMGVPHRHIINGLKSKEDAAIALKHLHGL